MLDTYSARLGVLALVFLGCLGCKTEPPTVRPPKVPDVTVSHPVLRVVPDFEYSGETQAKESVEVRARVGGYLKKVCFKEGDEVKQNQLLFEIDPDSFLENVAQAKGDVDRYDKELKFALEETERNRKALANNAISRSDYDKAIAQVGSSRGNLASAQAKLRNAELDLKYTKIIAPISGKIGRKLVNEGNLISAGNDKSTLLTTIVYLDEIYAIFYVDERTAQLYQKKYAVTPDSKKPKIKALLGLNTDEGKFPYEGEVDFADNQVDPATGTFLVRAVFANPNRILVPGYTVRLHLFVGDTHKSLVVSERVLLSDKGKDFVYVVDDKKQVDRRFVRVGAKVGEMVVIEEGLTKDDSVVLYGLQRLRPGMQVNTKELPMPGVPAEQAK